MDRVVIFGATSAIAQACARLLVREGASLVLVGRNPDKLLALTQDLRARAVGGQVIEPIQADLAVLDRHQDLVDRAWATLGRVEVVLIAHGVLPDQARCEKSVEEMLDSVNVNALSVASLLTIVANRMEDQGRGTIAVITSVAGDRGRKSNYVYGAAKGFVNLFLQGLRNRLYDKGIRVVTIKPGFVDTPMTAHLEREGILWAKPERVARGMVKAIEKGRDVVYLPWFWCPIMFVVRAIPERFFKRLSL